MLPAPFPIPCTDLDPPTPLPTHPLLQSGTARLAELEYFFPGDAPSSRSGTLGSGAGYDAEAKVKALWVWDLSQDLSEAPEGSNGRQAGMGWAGLAGGAEVSAAGLGRQEDGHALLPEDGHALLPVWEGGST